MAYNQELFDVVRREKIAISFNNADERKKTIDFLRVGATNTGRNPNISQRSGIGYAAYTPRDCRNIDCYQVSDFKSSGFDVIHVNDLIGL